MQAAPEANECPQDGGTSMWVQYQDHCYLFNASSYNYSLYNMAKAKSICQSMGQSLLDSSMVDISFCVKWFSTSRLFDFSDAQLLTIKNTEENQFVSKYMKEHPLATNRVWLGLKFSDAGKVTLTTNQEATKPTGCLISPEVCQDELQLVFAQLLPQSFTPY